MLFQTFNLKDFLDSCSKTGSSLNGGLGGLNCPKCKFELSFHPTFC